MARYADQTVTKVAGVNVPLPGVSIYVYEQNESLAALTEDGGGALANPVTSDQYGNFHFNADDGVYQLQFYYGGKLILIEEAVMVGEGPAIPDSVLGPLSAPNGASVIGYQPLGDDAEVTNLADFNDLGPLYAANWRDGSRTDKQILTKAFAAWQARGGTLHLEPQITYDLGTVDTESSIFTLADGLRNATLEGNGATFTIETVEDEEEVGHQVNILYLYNFDGVTIRNLSATDTGTFAGDGSTGAMLVVLDSDATHPSKRLVLDNVVTDHMNALLHINPGTEANPERIKHIRLWNCRTERTFYTINCQFNGDDLIADISTKNGNRAYFPYGVNGHKVRVRVENEVGVGFGANAACLIKAPSNTTTQNIELDVTFAGTLVDYNHLVALEFDGTNAVFSDIDVRVHVEEGTDDPDNAVTFLLRDFTGAVVQPTTSNVWRNIRLSGTCAPGDGKNILFETVPLTRTVVALNPGLASGWANGEIVAPGVAFKTTFDSEFYLNIGDLTVGYISREFSAWPDGAVDIRVTTLAYGSLAGPSDATCNVRTIHGTVAAGVFTLVSLSADAGSSWSRGTAATITPDDAGGTLNILIETSAYDNADSFVKTTFEYLGLIDS